MAISLIASTGIKTASATTDLSFAVTVPAHQAGDLIIATFSYSRSSGGNPAHSVPAGFFERGFARRDTTIAFEAVFDRFDTDNSVSSVTFTTSATPTTPISASVMVLRGVDPVSPVGPKYTSAMYNAQGATITAPLPDASQSGSYVITAVNSNSGHTISGLSTGFTDLTGTSLSSARILGGAIATTAVLSPGYTASKSVFWSVVAITYLPSLSSSAVPAAVSAVGWQTIGGSDAVTGLADSSDSTGLEATNLSVAEPVVITLGGMRPPTAQESLQVAVRVQRLNGSSGSWKGDLLIDGALASSQTVASAGLAIETVTFAFPAADIDSYAAAAWSSGVVVRVMPTVIP